MVYKFSMENWTIELDDPIAGHAKCLDSEFIIYRVAKRRSTKETNLLHV